MDNDFLQEAGCVSGLNESGSESRILIRLSEGYLLNFGMLIKF